MRNGHESPGPADPLSWPLGRGQVRRLRIGPGTRCLRVEAGQVWLTETSHRLQAREMASDRWLRAGEQHCLASGAEVVIEARGEALFQLLVPPQAGAADSGLPALASGWLRAASRWLQAAGPGRAGLPHPLSAG